MPTSIATNIYDQAVRVSKVVDAQKAIIIKQNQLINNLTVEVEELRHKLEAVFLNSQHKSTKLVENDSIVNHIEILEDELYNIQ